MGMKTREEDFVSQLIVDSTHAYLLCFTNTGRVYWLKVYEIPDVGAAGKGKSMQSLLDLQPGETVRAILPVRDLEEEGKFIFFATQKGTVKKTPLKDFSNVMARGIIAIGIDDDDELVAARITDRLRGRRRVTPKEHEPGAYRILPSPRTASASAPMSRSTACKRAAARASRTWPSPRIGRVNSIQLVDDTSELMVISQFGKIIRIDTKTIRAAGRATQGVRCSTSSPTTRSPRQSSFRPKSWYRQE
jgi:DNA gyrase subunit A